MNDDDQTGWIMAFVLGAMGMMVLGLFYVPDLRPERAALDCDRSGGVWSSETDECRKSDSPLAGLAS